MAYEWLGEVIIAFAARFGYTGLASLQFIWASTLTLLIMYFSYLRSKNVRAAFVAAILTLFLLGAFFTLRPQVMGYIFMAALLIALERYKQNLSKSLWWLPVLFLVWVNTHGTFFFGLGIFGIYWLTGLFEFNQGGIYSEKWTPQQRLHLLEVLFLCIAVLPLTPYGTRLAMYPFEMAFMQPLNVSSIVEWEPLSFGLPFGKIILTTVILLIIAQVYFRLDHRLDSFIFVLAGAFAAFAHIRFVLFFLLFLTATIAVLLSRWVPDYEPEKDKPALNLIVMLCVLGGIVFYVHDTRRLVARFTDSYPVQAIDYLRGHPVTVPMLNEYGWGGYMIYELYPKQRVFIDGRADFYEYAGVFSDYIEIMRIEPDAFRVLDRYDIQACLLQRKSTLATVLGQLPAWRIEYSDDVAVLFVRGNALSRAVAAQK